MPIENVDRQTTDIQCRTMIDSCSTDLSANVLHKEIGHRRRKNYDLCRRTQIWLSYEKKGLNRPSKRLINYLLSPIKCYFCHINEITSSAYAHTFTSEIISGARPLNMRRPQNTFLVAATELSGGRHKMHFLPFTNKLPYMYNFNNISLILNFKYYG